MHRCKASSQCARRPLLAYRLLFPLATSYALIAVPLWLVLRSRHPAVIGATWHGHEMLFGFALAVIAGFLSTRPIRTVARVLAKPGSPPGLPLPRVAVQPPLSSA